MFQDLFAGLLVSVVIEGLKSKTVPSESQEEPDSVLRQKLLQPSEQLVANLCFCFPRVMKLKGDGPASSPSPLSSRSFSLLRQMCNFPLFVFYSLFNSLSPTQSIRSMGTSTIHCHSHPPHVPKAPHDTIHSLHLHRIRNTPSAECLPPNHKSMRCKEDSFL